MLFLGATIASVFWFQFQEQFLILPQTVVAARKSNERRISPTPNEPNGNGRQVSVEVSKVVEGENFWRWAFEFYFRGSRREKGMCLGRYVGTWVRSTSHLKACTASWPLDFFPSVIRPTDIASVFHTLARHLDATLCLFRTTMSPLDSGAIYDTIRYDTIHTIHTIVGKFP